MDYHLKQGRHRIMLYRDKLEAGLCVVKAWEVPSIKLEKIHCMIFTFIRISMWSFLAITCTGNPAYLSCIISDFLVTMKKENSLNRER